MGPSVGTDITGLDRTSLMQRPASFSYRAHAAAALVNWILSQPNATTNYEEIVQLHAVAQIRYDVPAVAGHLLLLWRYVCEDEDVGVSIQRFDFALVFARDNEAVFQILAGLSSTTQMPCACAWLTR